MGKASLGIHAYVFASCACHVLSPRLVPVSPFASHSLMTEHPTARHRISHQSYVQFPTAFLICMALLVPTGPRTDHSCARGAAHCAPPPPLGPPCHFHRAHQEPKARPHPADSYYPSLHSLRIPSSSHYPITPTPSLVIPPTSSNPLPSTADPSHSYPYTPSLPTPAAHVGTISGPRDSLAAPPRSSVSLRAWLALAWLRGARAQLRPN